MLPNAHQLPINDSHWHAGIAYRICGLHRSAGERTVPLGPHDQQTQQAVGEQRRRAWAALSMYVRPAGRAHVGLVLEGEPGELEPVVRWPRQPTRPPRYELRYFLTSLPHQLTPLPLRCDSGAPVVRQAVRRPWRSETRLKWPRDLVLGEDACRVRSG